MAHSYFTLTYRWFYIIVSLTGLVFINLYLAFCLHNIDHSLTLSTDGQVIMSDGIYARLLKCAKYFRKHRTPDIRGI